MEITNKQTQPAGHSSGGRSRPSKGGRTLVVDDASRCAPVLLVLVVRSTDENLRLASLTPFQRLQCWTSIGDEPVDSVRQRDGSMLVRYATEASAQRALKDKTLSYYKRDGNENRVQKIPVEVTAHETLNSAKGVMFCRALEGVSDEVCEGLAAQGVIRVERIVCRRGDVTVPSHSFFLTFDTTVLPQTVKVGDIQCIPVGAFVPNLMRCFRCQKFDHTSMRCTGPEVCGRCSSDQHKTAECDDESVHCANCGSSEHTFSARNCPEWVKEKVILSLKVTHQVSYPEARDLYRK